MRPQSKWLQLAVVFMAIVLAGLCSGAEPLAAPATDYITPVKQVRAKDGFTPDFSGVWQGDNAVLFSKWLYVISCKPWRIQRLNADVTTADISYQDALVLPNAQSVALIHVVSRKLADGNGMMYVFFSSHDKPPEKTLYSFSLDAKTGVAAPKGQLTLPVSHIHWAMAPGDARWYAVCEGTKIVAYRFGEDGLPVEDSVNVSKGYDRNANGIFSPDGHNLYVAVAPDAANPNGRVDQYDCDVATGKLTYASALSLTALPHKDKGGSVDFCGVRPDGKYIYVKFSDKEESYLYVLSRESEKGTLTVASSDKPQPTMGPLSTMGNLNFNADGKSGCYLGKNRFYGFNCDSNTGVLTYAADAALPGQRCGVQDREHGNLFVVLGSGADSFKLKK